MPLFFKFYFDFAGSFFDTFRTTRPETSSKIFEEITFFPVFKSTVSWIIHNHTKVLRNSSSLFYYFGRSLGVAFFFIGHATWNWQAVGAAALFYSPAYEVIGRWLDRIRVKLFSWPEDDETNGNQTTKNCRGFEHWHSLTCKTNKHTQNTHTQMVGGYI